MPGFLKLFSEKCVCMYVHMFVYLFVFPQLREQTINWWKQLIYEK